MKMKEKLSNLFMIKDTSLSEDLASIEARIESAINLQGLFDIFQFIKLSKMKFRNEKLGKAYMIGGGVFLFGLMMLGIIFMSQMSLSEESFSKITYYFLCVIILGFLYILYSWPFCRQVLNTKQISDLISLKKAALDHDLEFEKIHKKALLQNFEEKFFIFQQGNHSRELVRYIKGKLINKSAFHYFKFHYIDEDTSTSTDANGNETTDTEYKHYDLYGIIVRFNTKNFIKISNHDKVVRFKKFIQWKTGSISFNKKFKVYTNDEKEIAFFLQPKVIEKIEDLYYTFPELDIELSPCGLLALSTPDQDLLNHKRYYGVDQLDLFKEEIKTVLDQTKLYKALDFINFLKEYHEIT